ncbi:GNAT family N-acetyltransferase [Enterobacter hormaechei]|nr:GNAT family N-acetyltransferase [Enterobacter hormaechei]
MGIRHRLFGWESSDFNVYQDTFRKYGGSINTHPDVVRFFMGNSKSTFRFWHYKRNGEVIAAYFDDGSKNVGLNIWREYPVSYDEIVIPVAPGQKVVFPQKTNRLSSVHCGSILNANYSLRQKRKICLVRESFSAKTARKRNSELRKFLSTGGEIYKLNGMPAQDIADLYVHLFKLRFAGDVRCYDKNRIEEMLSALPHMVFGNALFYKGAPCAIDLVLCGENEDNFYFDVPNGGLDPAFKEFSPGSLLMWKNISDARELCESLNKKMVYSIGLYEKNWSYKLMWADAYPTGKALMF